MNKFKQYIFTPVNVAPLANFRIIFGILMLLSIVRFWSNGWIESLYLKPDFHFTFYGFEWVKPIGIYTYLIFIICGLSALFVAIGYKYRLSIILFFLSFTYIELMDKTTYLNHYYFVSLMSFVMIFLPANVYASVDSSLNPQKLYSKVPRWTILIIKIMLSIVYFYAGLAKLNSDWLFHASPLKIWLPTQNFLPLVGGFMDQSWFHFAMSWLGAIYDLCIPFLLFNSKTRNFAFFLVVVFHVFTRILFPIGMFPFIMICSTLIFFSDNFHQRILNYLMGIFKCSPVIADDSVLRLSKIKERLVVNFLLLFIIVQLIWPFRFLAYPGELFWTEEGFRFSWRVMLMEKAGYITFDVKDAQTNQIAHIDPSEYLTPFQQKQMSFQPDFILEFAHHIADVYREKGFNNPQVYADSYVALNGRRSQRYVNPKIDLTKIHKNQSVLDWIMPFKDEIKGL